MKLLLLVVVVEVEVGKCFPFQRAIIGQVLIKKSCPELFIDLPEHWVLTVCSPSEKQQQQTVQF